MSRFFLVALLFLGVVALSYADTCIPSRTLKPKEACSRLTLDCPANHFCDLKGYCSPYKAIGSECSDDCVPGSNCKGSTTKKCIANASPGEKCNNTLTSDVPSCGEGLSCTNNGTCIDGGIGDKCIANSDCKFGFNCTDGFCRGLPVGGLCLYSQSCDSGLFCDTTASPSACKALLTSGKCSRDADCVYGYACISPSPSDASQCVKWGTKKVGEYCRSESRLCEGDMRCFNEYCAAGTPKYCTTGRNGECPYNKHCTCNSSPKLTGTGMCTPNPCYALNEAYDECITSKCKGVAAFDYPNSCASLNCKDQYAKQLECNPAVRVAVSILVLIATLVTLFI